MPSDGTSRREQRVLVTGPGLERETVSLGAGISLAQTRAVRAAADACFYVRAIADDRLLAVVERAQGGAVHTHLRSAA